MVRKLCSAPFGSPVVPDVYTIVQRSSGSSVAVTSCRYAAARRRAARAIEECGRATPRGGSARDIRSRRRRSHAFDVGELVEHRESRWRAVPRWRRTRSRAPECPNTYRSCGGADVGYAPTVTPPAACAPSAAVSHHGLDGPTIPTRSPRSIPTAASAAATRPHCTANSRRVWDCQVPSSFHRSAMPSGSRSPHAAIAAGWVGASSGAAVAPSETGPIARQPGPRGPVRSIHHLR